MYSVCKEDHDCIFSQESSFVSELFSTLPYFSLPSTWNPLPSPPPNFIQALGFGLKNPQGGPLFYKYFQITTEEIQEKQIIESAAI